MNEDMKFTEIPEPLMNYEDLYSNIKNLLASNKVLEQLKKNINKLKLEFIFRDFWNLCDTPIPVIFKYKDVYFITRNKERISEVIKMDEEMKFVELKTIPAKSVGRGSKDWYSILIKIPVSKAWIPKVKGVQTIREAIDKLVKEKKLIDGQYSVLQRTVDKVVTVYVANNGTPKKN
jgi:hypothetical protein